MRINEGETMSKFLFLFCLSLSSFSACVCKDVDTDDTNAPVCDDLKFDLFGKR